MEYWYKYRDDLWKKVTMNDYGEKQTYHPPKDLTAAEKLKGNIRRAARMIEGYALCNDWQLFVTLTLNSAYRDRKDLDRFRSDLMQFLRNQRRKYGCDIQAIFVPELHKNKDGWHMHGLVYGLPFEALRIFTLHERLPKYIRQKLKDNEPVYDWPDYRRQFGWVDVEPIKNRDAAARYITKYLTKSGDDTAAAIETGKHLYYVTRGLMAPVRYETENAPGSVPDAFPCGLITGNFYEFDYGEVQWYISPSR